MMEQGKEKGDFNCIINEGDRRSRTQKIGLGRSLQAAEAAHQ